MPSYTVVGVKPRLDKNTNQQYTDTYGNKGWYLNLTDSEGQAHSASYLGKKTLAVNESIEGDLEPKEYNGQTYYNFKFPKKDFQPGGGGGFRAEDPERQKLIIRQSSLKAAIDYYSGCVPEKPDVQGILDTAQIFTDWVLQKPVQTALPVAETKAKAPVQSAAEIDMADIPF